jgi:hypothetical protein
VAFFPGRICTVGEAWFEYPAATDGIDLLSLRQVAQSYAQSDIFATMVIDLGRTTDDIFAAMHKDCRYQLRRAMKEEFTCEIIEPDALRRAPGLIREFIRFYDAFSRARGQQRLDENYLRRLAEAGLLWFSVARHQGQPLAWHSLVVHGGRARMLYGSRDHRSNSPQHEKQVSNANRWLVWQNITAFHALGQRWFDLGGWYAGSTDTQLLGVNKFKESFGGTLRQEYDCLVPLTAAGRLYACALHQRHRAAAAIESLRRWSRRANPLRAQRGAA